MSSPIIFTIVVILGLLVSLVSGVVIVSYSTAISFLFYGLWLIVIPCISIKIESSYFLRLIMIMGLVSAVGTYYKWTQLRGYNSFAYQSIALDSDWNVYLMIISLLTFWRKLNVMWRGIYSFTVLLSIGLLVLTGTRTYLIVLTWLIVFTFIFRSSLRRPLLYLITLLISLLTLVFQSLPNLITQRYLQFYERVQIDGIVSVFFGVDDSTLERANQRFYFLDLWRENLLFGKGLGDIVSTTRLYADTPLATISKIGLVGLICILGNLLWITYSVIHRFDDRDNPFRSLYLLFVSILIPISLAYDWISSKSFWFSFSCTLGLIYTSEKIEFSKKFRKEKNSGVDYKHAVIASANFSGV